MPTLIDFVWDADFVIENGITVLCGTAKDSETGNPVRIRVRKDTIDIMASDYTQMESESGRGATDESEGDE